MVTEACPICGHRLPHEFLATHMSRAHPEVLPAAPGAPDGTAAPPSGAYQGDLADGLARPEGVPPPPLPNMGDAPPAPQEGRGIAGPEAGTPEALTPTGDLPLAAALPSSPSPAAPPSSAPAPGGSTPRGETLPSSKELRAWLAKHRRRTTAGRERAEAWRAAFEATRRRRRG